MKRRFLIAVMAICSMFIHSPARAGDQGLYPSAPPPGAAFVRFFNASNMPAAVSIRGKSYGSVLFGTLSSYAPVPQGDAALVVGPQSVTLHLKESTHYTAALVKGKLSILEEPANDNKLKSQIILINVSSVPRVSLKTADGATPVVNSVDPGKLGDRMVNAVTAPFSVYSAEKKIEDLAARSLERGERYAVVVYDGPDHKPAVVVN